MLLDEPVCVQAWCMFALPFSYVDVRMHSCSMSTLIRGPQESLRWPTGLSVTVVQSHWKM